MDEQRRPERRQLSDGRAIEVLGNTVTLEKHVRHLVHFVGRMGHRLAALAAHKVSGHVISGIMSADVGGARLLVLLYDHYPPDLESQDEAKVPVRLRLDNLPSRAGQAVVTVHRLDREHWSLYPLTVGGAAAVYSPEAIEELRKSSTLPRDETFPNNGGTFAVTGGMLKLDLTLGANRVLFVDVELGRDGAERTPECSAAAKSSTKSAHGTKPTKGDSPPCSAVVSRKGCCCVSG